MLELFGALWTRRRAADVPALIEALRAGASFLAQGASYSYLRARTLLAGPRLFMDDNFAFALEICKWEAFAVAAQDLLLILESEHRAALPPDLGQRARGLAAFYADVLAAELLPEHRAAEGWGDMKARFDVRLLVALAEPPQKPDQIAVATAETILAHAPILDDVREVDREMVINNTAMRFIDYQAKLRRMFGPNAIAQVLAERIKAQ